MVVGTGRYTLHKPARIHFNRRRVVVGGRLRQWQADLVDLWNLKNDNDGTTFLLTVIDVYSKMVWSITLKKKSATSLVTALKSKFTKGWPRTLQIDKGLEFLNRFVQALITTTAYITSPLTTRRRRRASPKERFNRTLKTRMWRCLTKHQTWRYVVVLQDFVRSYNDTPHRSIGMAPSQVNAKNQEEV